MATTKFDKPVGTEIESLNNNLAIKGFSMSVPSGVGITILQQNSFYTEAGIKCIEIQFQVTGAISKGATILKTPTAQNPLGYIGMSAIDTNGNNSVSYACYAGSNGNIVSCVAIPTGYYVLTVTYR